MGRSFATEFIAGAIAMGFLVLGVFFLKFWRRTRDGLFLIFAFAFWLLAANQAGFTFARDAESEGGWIYLLRLAAFLLIIAAIWRKNLAAPRR
jgi:Family of unknown function (DUF5985)